MIRLRILALTICALIGGGLAGCGDRQPLENVSPTIEGPYRVDTGDKLRVTVYEQPNLTNTYEVDQGGFVSLPLIGKVSARNATTDQIAARISAKLGASYLRSPNVTAEVATYRPFFV